MTICVLTSSSKRISKLIQFLEIGLNVSQKYKTKIVYLVDENDDKPGIVNDDWKKTNGPISCRFISYLLSNKDESRWFLQVDDDSCTDIDKTIELIDYFYDYQDPVMIHGSCLYFINGKTHATLHMDENLQKIIKEDMDISNMFLGTDDINEFELMPRFKHSWEHSLVSSAGVHKLKSCRKIFDLLNFSAKRFIDQAKTGKQGIADQIPYVAAKLAKIPIDENFIFCPLPIASEYTAINKRGRYTHIHHVLELWDELDNFKKIIKNKQIFENKASAALALENNSILHTFWYFKVENKVHGIIRFGKLGIVENFKNDKLIYWKIENNDLIFMDSDKRVSLVLNKFDHFTYVGSFLNNRIEINKMDIISLIGTPEIKTQYE